MSNIEKLTINGTTYECHEARMKEMRDLLPKLSGETAFDAQMTLLGRTVYVNGEALGDEGTDELTLGECTKLLEVVSRVNALDDSGN